MAEVNMNRRQKIISYLKEGPISFMSIANKLGMPLKELEEDLEYVSLEYCLESQYAKCKACGFEFKSDKRYHTPSKCPECRGERIESQKLSIKS